MKPIDDKVSPTTDKKISNWKKIASYFSLLPDKEKEADTVREISCSVQFRGATLWVLIFAIFIASLGLNINSTAVIIGAMLISPLMGPIIGGGLALGIKDYVLLRRAAKNYAVATVISVVTATLYFLITPYEGAQSELLARTSPTLYDVLIAFFGGAAGVVAVCTRGKGNVIPGVAIATALMPPLCTAGYGLANAKWTFFLGAFYLFFINTVFIGFATFLGVKALRFKTKPAQPGLKYRNIGRFIAVGIVLSLIPASLMTYRIIRDGLFESTVNKYIKDELDQPGTEIIMHSVDKENAVLEVIAVGREIKKADLDIARKRLGQYKMEGYRLDVVQGERGDSVMQLAENMANFNSSKDLEMIKIQAAKIEELTAQLAKQNIGPVAEEIRPEMQVLFPIVKTLSLARAEQVRMDSVVAPALKVVAVVRTDTVMPEGEILKLQNWLQARMKGEQVELLVQPL